MARIYDKLRGRAKADKRSTMHTNRRIQTPCASIPPSSSKPPTMLFLPALLLSLLTLPYALAATSPPSPALHTATLHALPVTPTPSKPQPLAILTYSPLHPHLSALKSFTPPANTSDADSLTSVVIYLDGQIGGEKYRSSVTATYGFHAPYKGRFRIVLDTKGEIVGASWHSYSPKSSPAAGQGKSAEREKGRGDFDILVTKTAPSVVFDKPAKGKGGGGATAVGAGAGGAGKEDEEEAVEKTFLQK